MARLRIVPVNRLDRSMLSRLGLFLEERFLFEAVIERTLVVSATLLNRERDQLFFNTLVPRVLNAHAAAKIFLLAVTDFDLYRTTQRFVFTAASDDRRVAAVSFHRLRVQTEKPDDDANLLFHRLVKQATHAVGRLYGLPTCHSDRCVMASTSTVYDIDACDSYLCELCQRRMIKSSGSA